MKNAQHVVLLAKARRLAGSGEGTSIRVDAGLSLSEVADAVGISTSTLWRWEHGQRRPQGERALAWASLLDELERAAL